MKLTQLCEGCGEEFLSHRAGFCHECTDACFDHALMSIAARKPVTVLKQVNERNKESKDREKHKRRHRVKSM